MIKAESEKSRQGVWRRRQSAADCSPRQIPDHNGKYREFLSSSGAASGRKRPDLFGVSVQIPYSAEQGILNIEQGIRSQASGNSSVRTGCFAASSKGGFGSLRPRAYRLRPEQSRRAVVGTEKQSWSEKCPSPGAIIGIQIRRKRLHFIRRSVRLRTFGCAAPPP